MKPEQRKPYIISLIFLAVIGSTIVAKSPNYRLEIGSVIVVTTFTSIIVGQIRARKYLSAPKRISKSDESQETIDLRPGERAIYHKRVTNPLLFVFSLALLGVYFYSGITPIELIGGLGWLYVIGGVSTITVHIDSKGLRVIAWPLKRPQRYVPMEDIAKAESIRIGRFHVYGMCWLPRRRAWAFFIRGREALEVHKQNGESLIVTITDSKSQRAS